MIQFKTPEIEKQFNELPIHNKRLRDVLTMLEIFVRLELKKDVMLTCILRTPEENAAQGGIPNSPHLVWCAADLRSSTYTQPEIDRIVNFLNCLTYRSGKQTAMCHQVPGGAMHFHVQVLKESEC